jgi:hypothetical protein
MTKTDRKPGGFTMLLGSIAGIAAYLALAVIGAGGQARFFSQPPFVALGIVSVVFAVAAVMRTRSSPRSSDRNLTPTGAAPPG